MKSDMQAREAQTQIVTYLKDLVTGFPSVLGMFVGGSYARGRNDLFSDIDVGVVFIDDRRESLHEIRQRVAASRPALCSLWLYDVNALFLFADGLRLDLDLHKRSTIDAVNWMSQTTIVYDPAGYLTELSKRPWHRAEVTSIPYWQTGDPNHVDWFYWMFRQTAGWLGRAAVDDARHFDKLDAAIDSIKQIRDGLLNVRRFLHGTRDYIQVIDPLLAQQLAATYPSATIESAFAGLTALIDIFHNLMPEYCRSVGLTYPQWKTQAIRQVLHDFMAAAQVPSSVGPATPPAPRRVC